VKDTLGHHLQLADNADSAVADLAEAVGLGATGVVQVDDPRLVVLGNVPERGIAGCDQRVELPKPVGTLPCEEIGEEPEPGLLCESDRGALEGVAALDIFRFDVSVATAEVDRGAESPAEFPRDTLAAAITVCRPVRDADVVFCHSVK